MYLHAKFPVKELLERIRRCGLIGVGVALLKEVCCGGGLQGSQCSHAAQSLCLLPVGEDVCKALSFFSSSKPAYMLLRHDETRPTF